MFKLKRRPASYWASSLRLFRLCVKLPTCVVVLMHKGNRLLSIISFRNNASWPSCFMWERWGGKNKIMMIIISDLFHSVNVRIIVLRSCTLIGARNEKTVSLITSHSLYENYLGGRWVLSLHALPSPPLLKLPDTFRGENPLGGCGVGRGGSWRDGVK